LENFSSSADFGSVIVHVVMSINPFLLSRVPLLRIWTGLKIRAKLVGTIQTRFGFVSICVVGVELKKNCVIIVKDQKRKWCGNEF